MAERDPQLEADIAAAVAPAPSRWRQLALMALVPIVLIGAVLAYYLANDHFVSTDNAYVRQDKVSVSAELTGRIIAVGVRENQKVKAGDLLFRLDPEPYRIAVAQADAALAAADVKVVGMEADLATKGADITTARSGLAYAQEQYNRTAALIQRGFATKAQMDAATQTLAAARGALSNAEGAAVKARAALATSAVAPGVNPAVLAAEAQKRQALYNLARTEVRAPVAGTISQADRLLPGQLMLTGLPAVSVVVSDKSWVEANFKETDLAHMRVGQPAELWFDAYPGMRLKGHVASIGAGTGSEFSVLPAQNANGNWVKVTQRVPVRIAIDSPASGQLPHQLIAGLSTNVRVDTSR